METSFAASARCCGHAGHRGIRAPCRPGAGREEPARDASAHPPSTRQAGRAVPVRLRPAGVNGAGRNCPASAPGSFRKCRKSLSAGATAARRCESATCAAMLLMSSGVTACWSSRAASSCDGSNSCIRTANSTGWPVPPTTSRPPIARDRHDVDVEIGRKSPVEPQLLLAEPAPPLQRRGIEEREAHRFLDLVGVRAREHDPGDVRFPQLQLRHGVRKCRTGRSVSSPITPNLAGSTIKSRRVRSGTRACCRRSSGSTDCMTYPTGNEFRSGR